MRHANHGDAQAAVQPPDALGGVDCPEAGPHGRVGALCALVRGQHARLDDPDRVRQDGRGGAGEGAGDEVVGRRGALGAAGEREQVLEAGFEEEEGGPAEGVAGEVRDEAAVERGEWLGAVCEGSQHGDGGEVVRGGAGGAGADCWCFVSRNFFSLLLIVIVLLHASPSCFSSLSSHLVRFVLSILLDVAHTFNGGVGSISARQTR